MAQIVSIARCGVHFKQLVKVAERRDAGTPMTHVLNYKISTQPLNGLDASAIRRTLKNGICDQQITEQIAAIPNMPNQLYPVTVTWRMPNAGRTSAYYYTEAGFLFSDEVIQRHAQSALMRITTQIRLDHPEYGNEWGLTSIVTRILGAAVLAPAQLATLLPAMIGSAVGVGDDEEDDDEDEEEAE